LTPSIQISWRTLSSSRRWSIASGSLHAYIWNSTYCAEVHNATSTVETGPSCDCRRGPLRCAPRASRVLCSCKASFSRNDRSVSSLRLFLWWIKRPKICAAWHALANGPISEKGEKLSTNSAGLVAMPPRDHSASDVGRSSPYDGSGVARGSPVGPILIYLTKVLAVRLNRRYAIYVPFQYQNRPPGPTLFLPVRKRWWSFKELRSALPIMHSSQHAKPSGPANGQVRCWEDAMA
jgi:hypothetical protein